MTPLSEALHLLADRVHLAEAWLEHGDTDQARPALHGVRDELVALAEEADR